MAGKRGSLSTHRIVIYVINSARKCLESDTAGRKVMLVVDECHRAGSRDNLQIFRAHTWFRLGLSATAGRDDVVDEVGNVVPTEAQPHVMAIGPVCYRLDLRRARALGLLPRYVIHHHRLPMSPREVSKYEELCREVQECKDELRRVGVSPEACNRYCTRPPPHATHEQTRAALALQASLFRRKQWLYGVSSRNRVARQILSDAASRFRQMGIPLHGLAFNERIDPWQDPELVGDHDLSEITDQEPGDDEHTEGSPSPISQKADEAATSGAAALFENLCDDARRGILPLPRGAGGVAIYHSRLGSRQREQAISDFAAGVTSILVSVKALIEGLDVPEANIGLSVASTASGRQRIQTMGRILRAPRDAVGNPLPLEIQQTLPPKEIHLLYVGETVDEEIYLKTNWSDLTGETENKWWIWEAHGEAAQVRQDPTPPKPPPTEQEAWAAVELGPLPAVWAGNARGSRWSYRQHSIVSEVETAAINPDKAISLLESASHALGDCRGKFVVTPHLHIVLKRSGDQPVWYALGRLDGPLIAEQRSPPVSTSDDAAGSEEEIGAPPGSGWFRELSQALIAVYLTGRIEPCTLAVLDADPSFPECLKKLCRTFAEAATGSRDPAKMLTNALALEIMAALRTGSMERVNECMSALRTRTEPWTQDFAHAIDQATNASAGGPICSRQLEVQSNPGQSQASLGTVAPRDSLPE
jgi:hypothetical protein